MSGGNGKSQDSEQINVGSITEPINVERPASLDEGVVVLSPPAIEEKEVSPLNPEKSWVEEIDKLKEKLEKMRDAYPLKHKTVSSYINSRIMSEEVYLQSLINAFEELKTLPTADFLNENGFADFFDRVRIINNEEEYVTEIMSENMEKIKDSLNPEEMATLQKEAVEAEQALSNRMALLTSILVHPPENFDDFNTLFGEIGTFLADNRYSGRFIVHGDYEFQETVAKMSTMANREGSWKENRGALLQLIQKNQEKYAKKEDTNRQLIDDVKNHKRYLTLPYQFRIKHRFDIDEVTGEYSPVFKATKSNLVKDACCKGDVLGVYAPGADRIIFGCSSARSNIEEIAKSYCFYNMNTDDVNDENFNKEKKRKLIDGILASGAQSNYLNSTKRCKIILHEFSHAVDLNKNEKYHNKFYGDANTSDVHVALGKAFRNITFNLGPFSYSSSPVEIFAELVGFYHTSPPEVKKEILTNVDPILYRFLDGRIAN